MLNTIHALCGAALCVSLLACGSDDNGKNPLPDGSVPGSDAGAPDTSDTNAPDASGPNKTDGGAPDGAVELPAAPHGGDPSKVSFPSDYEASFTYTTTVDKASNNQVRDVYANEVAMGSAGEATLARGSSLVMEVYAAQVDANNAPILDSAGRFLRGELALVAVMEKKEGNGQYSAATRNGEWEYAFFSPAGEGLMPDSDCFGCHLANAGADQDFVFTLDALRSPGMLPPAPTGGNNQLVRFPSDTASYTQYGKVDRADTKQVRELFANAAARDATRGEPLPRGSILMMKIFGAQLDGGGNPVVDGDGAFMKDTLNIIAIMEKKRGFGKYSTNRNDEWEYAFFTPEGQAMPSTADCYGCHANNAGADQDFVFSFADLP